MRIGNYLHWEDADQVCRKMLESGQWDNAWIEVDRLNGIRIFTLYGISKYPNEPLLIINPYDAY